MLTRFLASRRGRLLVMPTFLLCVSGLLVGVNPSRRDVIAAPNGTATPRPSSPAENRAGPFGVIVVVDAARFDEFDLSKMPNLAKLVGRGTTYSNAYVGQLPSITETSHATIGTGVLPKHHNILGDTWRIPGTNQMSPNLLDGTLVRTGYIGKVIQQTKSMSIGAVIHQRWPGSRVVALSGHKIYAADSMGAGTADFVAFGTRDARGHFVPGAIPGRAPVPALMTSPQLDLPTYPREPKGIEDAWATTLALKFLFKYHPRLMLINLPEVDTHGHTFGTDGTVMQPLMTSVDNQIGRLVAAYGRAGMLPQTYFMITSDHGMTPAVHVVDDAGIKVTLKKAGGDGLYVGHGDYSSIWLKNADAVPRVAAALTQANLANAPVVYMRTANGHYTMVSPATRLADRTVSKAYQDLLGTFNSGESPDIVVLYNENTITMTPLFAQVGRKGDHGGATWGSQHIPLILAGPGVRSGYTSSYPARLIDIAPTMEAFLLARPQHQDGLVLADSMIAPPAWAVTSQQKQAPRLAADTRALNSEATRRPNVNRPRY